MDIKTYIKTNHITQAGFANLVGVTQGMVGHWIAGRHKITPAQAVIIEEKTGGDLKKETLVFGEKL